MPKFKKDDQTIIDFANYLNEKISKMLYEDKITPNVIVGILQQQCYNVHRTMEANPDLVKEITEKWYPDLDTQQ